jgi:small-conductance mechanosensitive channel
MMKKLNSTFLIFLLVGISFAQQPNNQTSVVDDTEKKVLEAIPITEITFRADETTSLLSKIQDDAEPKPTILSIEEAIPPLLDSLNTLHANPILKDLSGLNVRVLQNLSQEWTFYYKQLEELKKTLQIRTQDLEKEGHDLKEMADIWQLTSKKAIEEKAPRAIRERVKTLANEIKNVDKQVSNRLNILLVLQNQISKAQIRINSQTDRIKSAEKEMRNQLFVIDSPRLWDAFRAEEDSLQLISQFQKSWEELIRSNVAFVRLNEKRFYLHLVIFALLIFLMIYLHRRNQRDNLFDEDDKALKASAYFVSRPFSAALLIALILSIWIYPEGTTAVSDFILLMLLFPVLRLIPGMLSIEARKPIYVLYGLFVIDVLQKNAIGFALFQRLLLLIVTLIAIVTLIWLIRPKNEIYKKEDQYWPGLLRKASPVLMLFLIGAFVANLIGSVSLASTITWGIVESSYILITLYIASLVATGLITVLIRRRRKRASQFVKTYALKMERWAFLTINLIAFIIWVRSTLKTFGFLQPFTDWFTEALTATWTAGTIEISVEAIFDFVVILIFTFVLVRMLRIFLDMEIFPRIKLPRGIPGAISMVVRYILVAAGIIIALSSLGINLGEFGLLAGALGVGLGFGLQNIIANFVSGLILAFERPIQVGDTVQVDTVFGNVQSIGVRSSTVKTFDGSEVIVPNADLISNRVTNWTLSDRRRRMELPVKVAFGHDPHQVLDLILSVAKEHPDVLEDPQPFSVFNGFGDNYLDFTLYYYIPTHLFFKAKTEVALGVHDLIKSKGIDTPRPQRDVRMTTSENPPTKQSVTKVSAKKPAIRKKPGSKSDRGKKV